MPYEIVGNLHMHTPYSDGEWYHAAIAEAAAQAGLHFIVVTDHNLWVNGPQGYHHGVLVLVGEEVHNPRRWPQVDHLLVYGAEAELSQSADEPQKLIEAVRDHNGLAFIAHPFDYPLKFAREPGIPWIDWDVEGYTGIEIWNYMSEFKKRLPNRLLAIFYAYNPLLAIRGPFRETLKLWDGLLASGKRVVGFGGADAHATPMSLGPFKRVVFPYEYLFRCVNTHLLIESPFSGEADQDKQLIYEALAAGRGWVGYDLIGSTQGFQFTARTGHELVSFGQEIRRAGAVAFEIQTPLPANLRLIKAGKGIVARRNGRQLKYISAEAGVYRAEAYRSGKGWIFSNPIYVH